MEDIRLNPIEKLIETLQSSGKKYDLEKIKYDFLLLLQFKRPDRF